MLTYSAMVIISKPLFYSRASSDIKCRNVIHEWTENCLLANTKLSFLNFTTGVFIFYLPVYMMKLIIDYKKIDKEYLKHTIKAYFKSECYGCSFGFLVLNTICLLNKIFGRLNYYNIGFIPGFVAGLSILFENPQNRHLNTLLWSSMVIESLFRNCYHFKLMNYSPVKETLIFMFTSSILMYLVTNKDKKRIPFNIWFYIPRKRKNDDDKQCYWDYLTEICKYFGIGYGISSAKSFISNTGTLCKNPTFVFLRSILNKKNFRFGMVFGVYVGLYRGVLELLQKYRKNTRHNSAIAGFIAGMSYYIKPTMNILTIAIVTTLQILNQDCPINSILKDMPVTEIIYMICNGILFHNRILAIDTCPRYYLNMLNTASRGLIDKVYTTVVKKYLLLDVK